VRVLVACNKNDIVHFLHESTLVKFILHDEHDETCATGIIRMETTDGRHIIQVGQREDYFLYEYS
jgi:hypothetical protein